MKGMVFTEFVEMVEEVFSPEIADQMIVESNVPSGGIYTAVGFYDHNEMLTLVTKLSELTQIAVPELVKSFGRHLLLRFRQGHPQFFEPYHSAFDFLTSVHGTVHVEVKKLDDHAELPQFTTVVDGDTLHMTYRSKRPFADLAQGLIEESFKLFGENVIMTRDDNREGDYHVSVFHLKVDHN